jgi:hypothetical protein
MFVVSRLGGGMAHGCAALSLVVFCQLGCNNQLVLRAAPYDAIGRIHDTACPVKIDEGTNSTVLYFLEKQLVFPKKIVQRF